MSWVAFRLSAYERAATSPKMLGFKMIKQLVLAALAALLLGTSGAVAEPNLPREYLGHWCLKSGGGVDSISAEFKRASNCAKSSVLIVSPREIERAGMFRCKLIELDKIAPSALISNFNCDSSGPKWFVFRIVSGVLERPISPMWLRNGANGVR